MPGGLKILSAAKAKPLADQLAARLSKNADALVLLVTADLADDPQKNAVTGEALEALAREALVVVLIGPAEPPLGLRDVPRLPWDPDGPNAGAQIDAIADAVSAVAATGATAFSPSPRSAAPAPKRRGGIALWIVAGIAVLLVVAIGSLSFIGAPMQGVAPVEEGPALVQPAPSGDASPQATISAQLEQLEPVFAEQGFVRVSEPVTGSLQQSETQNWPAQLSPGYDYRVIGVCDDDCSDLDLALYSASNELVAQDTSADDHPMLSVQPQAAGDYTLRVLMYQCDVAPCFYGIALYGRAIGVAAPADPSPPATAAIEDPNAVQLDALSQAIDELRETTSATRDQLAVMPNQIAEIRGQVTLLLYAAGAALLLQLILLIALLLRRREPRGNAAPRGARTADAPHPVAPSGGLFFASYSRKDRDKVDAVIRDIEGAGLPIWLDRIDIGGGATWPEAIVQAIRGARGVIVFCSPSAFDSDNVLREVNLAANYDKPLLPIMLEPASVPDSFFYYLSTRQMVDPASDREWRAKVLQSLKAHA